MWTCEKCSWPNHKGDICSNCRQPNNKRGDEWLLKSKRNLGKKYQFRNNKVQRFN